MLEHKCKECGEVFRDHEYDTVCPNWCSGDYTTEPVEVLGCPPHFRTTIIDDNKYCVDCGEEIKDEQ